MATAQRLLRLRTSKIVLRHFSDKIVRSKIKDNTVSKQSLSDYVWKNLYKWSDKTALVCAETKRSYSYSDVYKKSNKIASFLTNSKELRKGDVVATILPNVPEYVMIVLGAIQAGLKVTPLNPDCTREEITHCLTLSKPKLIFTLTDLWPNIYNVVKASKNLPIVVVNHRKEVMDIPAGAIKLSEVFDNTYPFQNRIPDWNDVVYLPYSSGTTGLFKCIELTNGNLVSTIHHISFPEFRIQTITDGNNQDVFPAILPMHHIFGLHTVLENLTLGCKAITIPKFKKETFIHVLENKNFTHCYLVPPLVQLLVNEPRIKPEWLTRMGIIAVGAAPLGVNDVQRLNEKTKGNASILQGYGLTEAAGGICWQTPYISGGVKIGGSGLIYPTMELKIENESDELLGSNRSGLISIRGPQVFKGYLDNSKATEAVMNSEGWLDTGDVGYYDEDGHLFITDRSKEMIKVKGYQVAPAELEDILRSHPDVEDAAVIGVPHESFGQAPKAFIVAQYPNRVNLKSIADFVAGKVVRHKHLVGGISIIDSIPKTASGKILRRHLKG